MEISPEEHAQIDAIQPTPSPIRSLPSPTCPVKIIIDTDVGTDFDDVIALVYVSSLADAQILGVTTNYGPTDVRARVADRVLSSVRGRHPERAAVPIIAGASRQIGTHREVFLPGTEGLPFFENDRESVDRPSLWDSMPQTEAAEFLIEQVLGAPGEVTIVSIGIMTNIALAIQRSPCFAAAVHDIVVMDCGSPLDRAQSGAPAAAAGKPIVICPNHNVSGDTMTSRLVFNSGIPLKVISSMVTHQLWVSVPPIDFLRARGNAYRQGGAGDDEPAAVIGALMLAWFMVRPGQKGRCPHNPLTVHEAIYGGDDSPVRYITGTFIMHEWAAFTTFVPHEGGRRQLGAELHDKDKFIARLSAVLMADGPVSAEA
jgi:inosine-uridine nucleoside N-ribohydrolase